jgi:hypothetical protein
MYESLFNILGLYQSLAGPDDMVAQSAITQGKQALAKAEGVETPKEKE